MSVAIQPETAEPTRLTLHMESATFYFVWSRRGHIPRHTHDTLAGAEAEAVRLAGLHPGRKFIVLQALTKFSTHPEVAVEPATEGAAA